MTPIPDRCGHAIGCFVGLSYDPWLTMVIVKLKLTTLLSLTYRSTEILRTPQLVHFNKSNFSELLIKKFHTFSGGWAMQMPFVGLNYDSWFTMVIHVTWVISASDLAMTKTHCIYYPHIEWKESISMKNIRKFKNLSDKRNLFWSSFLFPNRQCFHLLD